MNIRVAFLNANKWLLLIPVMLGAVLVFATIDTTVYTTQELVIIPAEVTADGWVGLESVLVQDVGEYALYQEFNASNAAYPIVATTEPVDGAIVDTDASLGVEGEVGSDTSNNGASDAPDSAIDESIAEPGASTGVAPDEGESTIAPEESQPEATNEPVVWGVFPPAVGVYLHAQEVSEVAAPESSAAADEPEAAVEQDQPNEVLPEEVASELVEEETSETGTPPTDEGSASEIVDVETASGSDGTGSESSEIPPEESSENLLVDPYEPVLLGEGEVPASSLPVCEEAAGCKSYALTFKGFTLPEFEGYTVLDNAQLRLSIAAKRQTHSNYTGPQRFRIEYRYGSSSEYAIATVVDVEDELSNGINGGYQLVSFLTPPSLAALANLDVRVVYDGNLEAMEAVYVESVWLEVKAGSFYEDKTTASTTDAISYERSLESPKFHNLHDPEVDRSLSVLPSFTMSYDPQQNFIRRVLTAIFSDNKYQVKSIRLTDSEGEVIDIAIETIYHEDTTWTLQFREVPQKLRAGKYRIEIVVNENQSEYVDSFEFYWGVLAVNPTKSIYEKGESVELHMAALTDKGDTICDADLQLKIIDPEHVVTEVPVERSGACGKNNVTDIPDYLSIFRGTQLSGSYVIQLAHYNVNGDLVHLIEDEFEVREEVAFSIERTAPTRIYPLAAYEVAIDVVALYDFVGDITESVPRGFVFEDTGGAEVISRPEITQLVWKDVSVKAGEKVTLRYRFDAPDISPYMYLLGPLDISGFREIRRWQIASDALSGIGWFTSTRTVGSTNLNNALSPLQWSTSTFDNYYFSHATSSDSHEVTLRQEGDYLLAVNVPMIRTDGTNSRSRVGVEVRINGVAVPEGLGRSGYIRNANGHNESSSHANFLLTDIQVDDVLEVYVGGISVIETSDIVNVSGRASLYLEYIGLTKTVFSATTTRTTNSTNLNQVTAYSLEWVETRQDTGYVHSDSVSPENITISDAGTYLVHISIPLTNSTADDQAVLGRVRLDGVQVPGGVFAQGYARALEDTDSDEESSIHWTGVVTATTSNQILTVTTERDGVAGTSTVTSGFVGSIYIEKVATVDTIVLRGTTLSSGTDWSPAGETPINFNNQVVIDTVAYTHSTTTNSDDIIVDTAGDYLLTFNAPFNVNTANANTRVTVSVNGVSVSGAQTKSNYIRYRNAATNHNNSSSQLVFLLEDLAASATINVSVQEEGAGATLALTSDVIVTLTKKIENNERPDAPTLANVPFNNIRFASTTPYFDFESSDPDGSSDLTYEFQIGTSSDFIGAITRYSSSSAGFSNTASTTDTSPFIEGDNIRFQLQSADALTDLTTYYWRVRARDVTGSGEYGDWSVTQSLTVDLAVSTPNWYQSLDGQFQGNDFVGTVSGGNDQIQVDAADNQEIMAVYAEGTEVSPRYRIWDGTSWSVESSAQAVSNTINWVETAAGVNRNEYALATIDQSNDAFVQIYQASSSSWGNQVVLSDVLTSSAYRGIALAYESLSGDLMAISCTNGPDPVYRIWDGTSWSATSTINASSLNNCNYLAVASDPASDEIIVVVRDTGTQYEAWVWDGSNWVANRIIGVPAAVAPEGMAVEYESSGDQAVITVSNSTNPSFFYTTWNGSEFSVNATQGIGNDLYYARLVSDPESDKLLLCYIDADSDVGAIRWDGGIWLGPTTELTTTGNSTAGRPVDCEYETLAGRVGNIVASYGDTGAVDGDYHAIFASTTSTWTSGQAGSNINDALWVQTERAGDGLVIALHYDDENDRIDATRWNGSSWTTSETLEAALPAAGVYEAMSMSARRFQFIEGTVQTPFINFNFVPNQPTWGDVTFNTSEPFGTDVKLRLRYTATTTCDADIPDSALPGNAAGFDVSQSPIDITGLSTTTYSQICLEATLTTQGSESAALTDWILSWEREPRLIQSAYRWYVNGSFLTPTDAWPAGSVDIAESTAIDSAYAISDTETIRLRLALEGANVTLPELAEQFKLQYAEGFTCSPSLSWRDVGDSASTTALWRGYENSVVGDDWYGAAWQRRIKLTVDSGVVMADVANFPVYVDLSLLPAGFFSNVQSDGDDIRITESDGVSELPFELVSLSTVGNTGELHFKADLSSTTDTEFYIYYGNPSASGYAASATYGSQNVWTNSYSMRHALDDNPTTASPQFKDSTSNSNDAVAYSGMTSGDVVSGKIGNAIELDGNDGGTFETALAYAGQFTASLWWRASTTPPSGDGDGFAIAGPAGANEKMGPWNTPAGTIFTRTVASTDNSVTHPANLTWTYVVLTRDSSNVVRLFVNGTTSTLYGGAAQAGTSDWVNFGGETSQGFEGRLDELRFASVQRSTGWIATEYNNQSNPDGFFAVSAEELISDGRSLPTAVLVDTDLLETYEEENPTRENQNSIPVGSAAEWDFVLENNGATANTNYCFRMVYEDGAALNTYTQYPRLITNAPPNAPVNEAPFDNEQTASTSPWFEFYANDALNDLISYEIEIDDDPNFGSPAVTRNSVDNFSLFTNLANISERSQYTSGQTIQFIPNVALSNGVTYWWRVRGRDDIGSNTYGDWSTPTSVTIDTGTAITTWFQTTGAQFSTNSLADAVTSTTSNDIGIDSGFTTATVTSSVIDYDDRDTGNAWGELSFVHNVTSGSIRYYVEYRVSGDTFALVPDTSVPGNSSGFTSSPVTLTGLNTTTYNELRIRAVLSGNSTLPRLQAWTVTWAETTTVPELLTVFDNAKVGTTSPAVTFYSTDPEDEEIRYEVQISTSPNFTSSSTFLSGIDAGFSNVSSSSDTSPFVSGDTVQYRFQTPLSNGVTYWWRVRARDPLGSDTWTEYSSPRSFTVDTGITTSVWYQTTGDQFTTNSRQDIATSTGAAEITTVVNEMMIAYGEGVGQAPRYRLWNGTAWDSALTADSVGAQVRIVRLKASPTRSEYVLGSLGTDNDVNVQVYNGEADTWGNTVELYHDISNNERRAFDLAYESNSGDVVAVSCAGTDAVYRVWNGTSWTATSTINLTNTNNCEWVLTASDPISDEIVAVFRHTVAAGFDYEAMVWNGSTWTASTTFGELVEAESEGMALAYEESGGQAVLVVSTTSVTAATALYFQTWDGSSWSVASTSDLGDHLEFGVLQPDVGTDRLALCYVDNDNNSGFKIWNGSSWEPFVEVEPAIANGNNARPIDCAFETDPARDGDLVVAYSDNGTLTYYQTYDTALSGEVALSTLPDGYEIEMVRGDDGRIHVAAYDDGAATNDDVLATDWSGSWGSVTTITGYSSQDANPEYTGGFSMAARTYPVFTGGSMRSTTIDFNDGDGPRWERITLDETTPGASSIEYRLYYRASTSEFALVPDGDLPGNSAGFGAGPIDISALDTVVYNELQLDAQFICSGGNCPTLNEWSVEWSEGISVSGLALAYDQLTALSTGTIAVAVNGVLLSGKTATLGAGTTTEQVVFDTAGTSTFTVPSGVTNLTIKAWGAGGGAGGGGTSDAGGAGGGGGFVQGDFTVTPSENLSIRVGGGGEGGQSGIPPGAGGGGGYSGVYRSSTPLAVAGAGGGGGGGTGGVRFVAAGTGCAVSGASCTPTIPAGVQSDDVYIAVLHSRTNTAHTCTANCTGWTEFSTQAGSAEGRLSVWYYRQSGAAPGNPTFGGPATESYAGRIWAFRGVATSGNPYDVLGTNTAVTPATTTFAGDNLNSTVADAMVVHVTGSMDDNTWGTPSGSCTFPTSVNATYYTANAAGTDNSVSLCYGLNPQAAAGALGTPINTQAVNGPDTGRYFTFALRPNSTGIMAAGRGGAAGGLVGEAGVTASTTAGGGGGTQSTGGGSGGGTASVGASLSGGNGSGGSGGGAGGAGGLLGGGTGGTGNFSVLGAAGGGGGAGYFGGGGANNASGVYISGAGGGGGSSFIASGATATSTSGGSADQPGNSGDSDYYSGVGVGGSSATSSNGSAGGDGRVVITWSVANAPGAWSIPNVPAFAGDVITVFVLNASGTAEAVAVTKYDGAGDITGMQLAQRHLTVGSDDAPVVSNSDIGMYDNGDNEDLFHSVSGASVLSLCAESTCTDARLRVLAGSTYAPGASGSLINFQNSGTFAPATNTLRVSGAWQQMATFTPAASTIIFTATSGTQTLENATTSYVFNNVTFGETTGSAVWSLTKPLDITGTLGIDQGTLARGTSSINIEQNLRIGTGGLVTGLGTTTFDGSGSNTWTDQSASSTNVGYVVIDGTSKTITLGSNVGAQTVTIGADDTLNASGSGYNINVVAAWTNNNSFIPQSGTVTFVGTSTTGTISRGASSFNNLTFTGAGSSWSFSTSTLTLNGSLTIATGTVTLPTGTTTIAGSFINSGGIFLHNNGEVRMTSTVGGRSITQGATVFNNAFYDLVFTGTGGWSFTESAATTSRNFRITAGTVTFPSGTLTVGGDFLVSGSGAFTHNNGEVVLLVQDSNSVTANSSSFNNLRTRGAASGSWYNDAWDYRIPVTVQESQIDDTLTNFPVYVNLNNLPSGFWSAVQSDGDDLRVTQSDGVTEVPVELVSINTGTNSGEFYFRATALSSTTNTTFYLYYGNTAATSYASTSAFGARNVWSNGYRVVAHSGDLTTATLLNSAAATSGSKTSAGNPAVTTSGRVGSAQDFSADSVQFAGNVLENQSQYNVSLWFNADALTGGNADEQNFGRSLYGISASGAPYQWLRAGGTANADEMTLCAYTNSTTCTVTSGVDLVTGTWYYASVNAIDAGATTLRVNGVQRLSFTNPGDGTVSANFTLADLRPARGINWDGRIDEVRVSNVTRTDAWRDAEYRNLATSTSFYTAGGVESARARVFASTNMTVLGNLVFESGGDALLPTGVLSVGGSFDNDATFDARSGTVRFNSTAGSETIAVGTTSNFATLEFNSATGDFTITENATATVAINLTNATQFTLQSGRTLAALGTFTNAASGTATTWTGSTLLLGGGGTVTLNSKTHGGDTYGTLRAASSTLVRLWNSSAAAYETTGTTSAIYSQDHGAVDGDLYIYGNYTRTSGTEYWSYATDFDGVALGTSSVRQVDVRIGSSSVVTIGTSTLEMLGVATASTSVDAVSGAYDLILTRATTTAQHFTFAGMNTNGVRLVASTSLSTFTDGALTVAPGRSGISVDGATVNRNASGQFYRVSFATTTAGAATNVTLTSSSSNFLWFRAGGGNLYGEAYDAGDSNPGSIRFDNSSNIIAVSGVVYSDDGTTPMGTAVCNGSAQTVRIIVDGGTYASSTSCASGTGAYSFPNVAFSGDPKVVVFLDLGSTTLRAAAFSKTLTANVTNMDLYGNRLIVRHEDTAALTISDLATYDADNESDLPYVATTSPTSTLTVLPNTELYVWRGKSFAPGGNVTLAGNANSNGYEGTLQLGANAQFTATGTETHTLAGRLVIGSHASFTPASSTVVFNATTSGKSVTSTSTIAFHNVRFTGTSGTWNLGANLLVYGDMEVASGTVTGTGSITLPWGNLTGSGVLSLGSGTVTLGRTNTLGGSSAWTVNNLTLGNGTVVGTTTPGGTATTTVLGALTISNAHVLDANNSRWDLAGTGTVLVETGTFLEDTSTVRYSGAGANVTSTTYYDLVVNAGLAAPTYTAVGSGLVVLNNLNVGGATSTTFTLNTNDPTLEVRGSVAIAANGTLQGSNSALFTVLGSWDNDGVFVGNGGTVLFAGTGSSTIAAGASSFSNVTVNGTGSFTVTEPATSTSAFTLTNHSSFTVSSGQTLAVGGQFGNGLGGAFTTWTGSTLYLFGTSTYEINASTTGDVYSTLSIGAGAQIRMWNSSASSYSVNSTGSLYSMDHAGVDGDLYIYGLLVRSSGSDFWSYSRDFDGTNLSSGRVARVYFAAGASAVWTGGNLTVAGTTSASTTLQNQGSGTYSLMISGTASTSWDRVTVRDIGSSGVVFSGTPTVVEFSRTDHLVKINSASAITIGGTVLNANPAKNFTSNIFEADTGVTGAVNVTATGTATAAWRFTNHSGDIAGEAYDVDPDGDPGYIVWDNSAALITVSGNVYGDEGSTVSTACDGSTTNIRLVVAALTTYNATCTVATGAYSIPNVAYNTNDTLVLYINDDIEKATTVTVDPISSITNLHLYENRVIVRHEGTDPITIDDMAVWDSSDDVDIQYTAVSGAPDTLSLGANRKLLVWTGKTFAPGGNVTVSGGGGGAAYDGTLEVQDNGTYRASGTETHSVGGSLIFGSNAVLVRAQSTFVMTTTGAARTVDVNNQSFHSLSFTGSGSWTVTDSTLTLGGSLSQSAGVLTFPAGTTTVAGAFNATGGSFAINGSPLVFTATTTGNTVRFDDATVASLTFSGVGGGWNMTDTNATATGAVIKTAGSLTLPSGNFAVGGSFENRGGTITHNTSDLIMTSGSTATITASSSDLYALRVTGVGPFRISDANITFLDDFVVGAGSVTVGTGTLSVGGSFTATAGTFVQASGTVLLNASASGKTVNPGNNSFHNLQISAPAGGYTFSSATTTNNFTISSVSSFTLTSGQTLRVGGVFTNAVGGAATTWTGSTLVLQSGTSYNVNSRSQSGDVYGTLDIRNGTDVRTWYSSAATTTVAYNSSLYSQDNNNVNGHLYIYGDFNIATTTEHWSYATDFDGTTLSGSERKVSVYLAAGATTTLSSGALQLLGAAGNVTSVENLTSSTSYALLVNGGTFNANHYSFTGLGIGGVQFTGTPTITELSNGYFALTTDTEPLITLSSTTLNANPSKTFDAVGFSTTGILTGYNIELVGDTANAWRFTNSYGNLDGEGFDIDGVDACGSLRWDNSACLLTSQTHVRWRYNNGGEGVPNSEWYDVSWSYRKRVRFVNEEAGSTATTALKMSVTYDSDMQSDFDDLRFTDDDGTTLLSHWVEKYTPSVSAEVWVEVPSVAAADTTTVFMYYGSSTASNVSSGVATFAAFDDFEDNSISEYSGDTSLFQTDTNPVYGGTYALEAQNQSGRTTDGIYRTDLTVAQGEVIRWMQYVSTANPADEGCTLFGVQSPGSNNQNYAVCLELLGTDRISLSKNVTDNDVSGTVLATTTVTYSTGWYEVEVDWQTDDTIDVYLYNTSGTLVATTSATDSSYTSGGIGFTFWFQKGAWDSYTSRARGAGRPTVYFGAEQVPGGANWSSSLDAAGNDYQPGDVARLRVAIENSGLDITGQEFQLAYAAKGAAPTCGSVAEVDYQAVPNQASCGSSPICMATSTQVTDGAASTDQLFGTEGTFVAGGVVTSPSNKAAAIDIDQDYYTELEYVITPTVNAADAYCFRVTNNGTMLDYYATVAELSLQFDPVVAQGTLNAGAVISLTPGTTTVVVATTSVVDGNGVSDLAHATATVYRSALGASCTPDNNNCYRVSTESGQCSFTNCSGIACTLQCTTNIFFHADPTDFGDYEGQEWFVFFEAEDQGGGYGFNSSLGIELQTLRGITVDSLINYGSLEVSGDTGATNATTTVANQGNVAVDVEIEGTDLTDGYSSVIPATQQKFSTSTFSYAGCVSCLNLSSSTPVAAGLALTKPANITPPVEADVYWGIAVPLGSNAAPHSGTNIFTPVSP